MKRVVLMAAAVLSFDPTTGYWGNGDCNNGCGGSGRNASTTGPVGPSCGDVAFAYMRVFDDPRRLTENVHDLGLARLALACRQEAWSSELMTCIDDSRSRSALDACWRDAGERVRVARIADNTD